MADSKVEKQHAALLKAQKRLGITLVNEEKKTKKRRDGRLIKLGVLAERMFLAGDVALLARFESAALEQFSSRKGDRLDFELDEPLNWFDKVREEGMIGKAQVAAGAPTAKPAAATASAAGATSAAASTKSAPPPVRANTGGGATNGAGAGAPSTTASA